MNDTEAAVKQFLESINISCEKIPETSTFGAKVADFRASSLNGASYTIEVKGKEGSDEFVGSLTANGIAETVTPITHSAALHKKLRRAEEQLAAVSSSDDLRLVWMIHSSADAEAQHDRLMYTLYGIQILMDVDVASPDGAYLCYFLYRAAFAYQEGIDAVVSCLRHHEHGEVACLFLNPFSARLSAMRASQLGLWFKSNANVHDVDSLRNSPVALFHDDPFVSADLSLRLVQAKYNAPGLIRAAVAEFTTVVDV